MSDRSGVSHTLSTGLDRLRENERRGLLVAGVIGFGATTLHWTGLVLGGLLVGIVSETTLRAIFAGLAFGLLVWLLFLATLFAEDVLVAFAGMGQLTLLNVGVTLGFPTIAAAGLRALT